MAPSDPPAWDPGQYARFEQLRLRPALDLIARLPALAARRVVDLGCGAGGPTLALAERFPEAEVLGVDASEAMLRKAEAAARAWSRAAVRAREGGGEAKGEGEGERSPAQGERSPAQGQRPPAQGQRPPARPAPARGPALARAPGSLPAAGAVVAPRIRWLQQDLVDWRADEPIDLLFSNAALHWLPDHQALFARLARSLAPGGVLAVQMPWSHDLASHRLLRATLAERAPDGLPFGSDALRARCERRPVAEPLEYRRMLAPWTRTVDVWLYEYEQELAGEDAVLEWVKGSALVPVLAELEERPAPVRYVFLARTREQLAHAYPPAADGRTRFAFPRLFLLARA